jgi:hypothetical protein
MNQQHFQLLLKLKRPIDKLNIICLEFVLVTLGSCKTFYQLSPFGMVVYFHGYENIRIVEAVGYSCQECHDQLSSLG